MKYQKVEPHERKYLQTISEKAHVFRRGMNRPLHSSVLVSRCEGLTHLLMIDIINV